MSPSLSRTLETFGKREVFVTGQAALRRDRSYWPADADLQHALAEDVHGTIKGEALDLPSTLFQPSAYGVELITGGAPTGVPSAGPTSPVTPQPDVFDARRRYLDSQRGFAPPADAAKYQSTVTGSTLPAVVRARPWSCYETWAATVKAGYGGFQEGFTNVPAARERKLDKPDIDDLRQDARELRAIGGRDPLDDSSGDDETDDVGQELSPFVQRRQMLTEARRDSSPRSQREHTDGPCPARRMRWQSCAPRTRRVARTSGGPCGCASSPSVPNLPGAPRQVP